MKEHHLKTWPSYFEALESGKKKFEWRRNDRDFAVGDTLVIREFVPPDSNFTNGCYTGKELLATVTYKVEGVFGIPEGYCVLSLDKVVRRK